ncbi:transposase [Pseudomonas aeruginosa]|uniref:transposase n=1 Tax=Pseudomonas aeruginosa TaxID=287 RepID=UPI003F526A87
MDGNERNSIQLKPIGIRANGGREYDPADKVRLVLECLKPGVSVAGLAVAHGLNPNLVRKWISDYRKRQKDRQSPASPAASAFIEIVAAGEPIKAITTSSDTEHQSVRPDDAGACVQTAGLFEHDAASDIVLEKVTPLLATSLEALTDAVLSAVAGWRAEPDPMVVRHTLERRKRLGGWADHEGDDSAVEQASETGGERMELPDIGDGSKAEGLAASLSDGPPRYLRTYDAALFLRLSARTMEKHRCCGTGPVYRKLGGRVVYALSDLEHWANRGIVSSTSDSTMVRAARTQRQREE